MAGRGFIHDKLEIKFLILYITARVIEPIPFDTVNSRICESSLPYSVRLQCDKNLATCNRKLRRKSQVRASWEKRPNGTYTVSMALDDDTGSIMDLKVMAVREDMAVMLAERFRKAPEKLYSEIMNVLLSDGQDMKSEK